MHFVQVLNSDFKYVLSDKESWKMPCVSCKHHAIFLYACHGKSRWLHLPKYEAHRVPHSLFRAPDLTFYFVCVNLCVPVLSLLPKPFSSCASCRSSWRTLFLRRMCQSLRKRRAQALYTHLTLYHLWPLESHPRSSFFQAWWIHPLRLYLCSHRTSKDSRLTVWSWTWRVLCFLCSDWDWMKPLLRWRRRRRRIRWSTGFSD